jgi:acyl-CoA thioester hydrolase
MSGVPPIVFRTPVLPEWIDYNGHMNVAYYVLVFDKATDALFDRLGIGEAYRRATDRTVYALEAHVTWQRELKEGEPIAIASLLVGADEKRLRLFHRMIRERDGMLAATNELLLLHVDLAAGPRSAPFPEAARPKIAAMLKEHAAFPAPPELGRAIALPPRKS